MTKELQGRRDGIGQSERSLRQIAFVMIKVTSLSLVVSIVVLVVVIVIGGRF